MYQIKIDKELIFEGARLKDPKSDRAAIVTAIKFGGYYDKNSHSYTVVTKDSLTGCETNTNFDTLQRCDLIPQSEPQFKKILCCPRCSCYNAVTVVFWGHHLWAIEGQCANCGANFYINKEPCDISCAKPYSETERERIFAKYIKKLAERLKNGK